MSNSDLLNELTWRGLLHQTTGEDALASHLASPPRRVYAGFDPTADSLTIGNLVPLTVLAHFQRAGHTPVVVMGGGTGLIGDPSGKSAERQLMTRETVQEHVNSQRRIYEALLDFDGPTAATIVDNADWLCELSYIDVLRDVGKHFSVNMMIQKDSVRDRLHNREQGISYTEFSYMVLQAYDFLHLHRAHGVTIQAGGSDQWGNIVAGTELIRKSLGSDEDAFGITAPLVTKADGGKFGKTESGAIWLTPDRTSAYAFYQFWLNASDEDVGRFLRLFTFLSREEVEGILSDHESNPGVRAAQRTLAQAVTDRLHGREERERAETAASALFSGDVRSIPEALLEDVFGAAPASDHPADSLSAGMPLLDLVASTLASSKSQARQLLSQGSVSVNGEKANLDTQISSQDLLHGRIIALRRGKKTWHVTRWR